MFSGARCGTSPFRRVIRRFLIIGHGAAGIESGSRRAFGATPSVPAGRRNLDRFIERGPLLSDDGDRWMGGAMLVELPDRASVDVMLAQDPYVPGRFVRPRRGASLAFRRQTCPERH